MVPERVDRALTLAAEWGFEQSCDADVGRFLSVLASAVPTGGRILEIGTGAGVGTAWLVEGASLATDIELVTVEVEETLAEHVSSSVWPDWVQFEVADALEALPRLGKFDLVFADAVAGKWYGLDLTLAAISPGGFLVVDDMTPDAWADTEHEIRTHEVRLSLFNDQRLSAVEIGWASGLILAARRRA